MMIASRYTMDRPHHLSAVRRVAILSVLSVASVLLTPTIAAAQWSQVFEQFYFPDKSNWAFRHNYPAADRLFNAFDYGHAILYEKLYTKPGAPTSILEEDRYNFITRELLVHPPRVPLEEGAIEVAYAKIAPEAKAMFDWAHVLHRQVYDVWADESIPIAEKDARVAKLLAYYRSRRDLAYSTKPKSMELMEGQYYSLTFRQRYPKFNGLIWAYHWLQIGLYEPLMAGKNLDERQTGVLAAVARFRQMIEEPPTWMPRMMPMTAAVAPVFTERYPEAAAIFDNLHSMHDVISDILASEKVPRDQKRAEILKAAARYRDDTSYVMTVAEWKDMARMMGLQNMGGAVIPVLTGFPTPTMERGVAAHEAMGSMGNMPGMPHGNMPDSSKRKDSTAAMPNMPGMQHKMPMAGDTTKRASERPDTGMMHGQMQMPMANDSMRAMHERLMADPVIRKRVMADTALRRMMQTMMPDSTMMAMPDSMDMPAMHHEAARPSKPAAKKATTNARSSTPSKKPVTTTKAATGTKAATQTKKAPTQTKKADTPTKKAAPPMDHSKMPGMKMPETKKP